MNRLRGISWSLRTLLVSATIVALIAGNSVSIVRLRQAESELASLRREVGSLYETPAGSLAAVRIAADTPLTYRFRVRTPLAADSPARWNSAGTPPTNYRIAYSTILPRGRTQPQWYSAIAVPAGESVVTIQIAEDPRDERWKISTLVRSETATRRMGTVLPDEHTRLFRQSHDVVSTGLKRQNVVVMPPGEAIRLLDDRWLVGEQSLLLYGDKAPDEDQIGVYAELQSADKPLS